MVPWKTSVFDDFFALLISPDGRSKPKRQALQHSRQAQAILNESSQGKLNFASLFDRKQLRDNWLVYFETVRKPGTVKSYLYSLRFFYKFIQTDHPCILLPFENRCAEMINIVENWIAVYRQKQKSQNWKQELQQLQELITSADIQKFDQSSHVEKCKLWLNTFKKEDLTLVKFSNVRDFIMISLCLDNASRTGAIANMTIGEFMNGKHEGEIYRVHIIDHKTLDTSGPAVLSFSRNLAEKAENYLTNFRNELDGISTKNTSKFFVSWNGNTLSSSMVTTQLNSFWGKTVGHTVEKPKFNATKVSR